MPFRGAQAGGIDFGDSASFLTNCQYRLFSAERKAGKQFLRRLAPKTAATLTAVTFPS
jgi:hypothetical protein